ncbi:MAG TPA: response regulator [Syntrophales bacterium]|nr:response regulator [Syntrophales bacterium]HOM08372.1 response regulator [Syntrophales bacterium]HOO01015.1 response regulator [Syntrophales bacterium]
MKILVVDDSAYARRRIVSVLTGAGYEVKEARDGEDALRALQGERVDLVTVDLLMPGMGGVELIERLRGLRPHLPVVVSSADVQRETREEVLALGVKAFVSKTAPDEVLLAAVEKALQETGFRDLTPEELDAFCEIMNIAMGQAAEALGVLLRRRVRLMVPEVRMMRAEELGEFFRAEIPEVGVAIRQRFAGLVNGVAAMVFSEGQASFLLATLADIHKGSGRLSSEEQSVLTEMGNIVLNAAIAILADRLGTRLRIGLPVLALAETGDEEAKVLTETVPDGAGAFVLVSRLSVGEAELVSHLILLMPGEDVEILLDGLKK